MSVSMKSILIPRAHSKLLQSNVANGIAAAERHLHFSARLFKMQQCTRNRAVSQMSRIKTDVSQHAPASIKVTICQFNIHYCMSKLLPRSKCGNPANSRPPLNSSSSSRMQIAVQRACSRFLKQKITISQIAMSPCMCRRLFALFELPCSKIRVISNILPRLNADRCLKFDENLQLSPNGHFRCFQSFSIPIFQFVPLSFPYNRFEPKLVWPQAFIIHVNKRKQHLYKKNLEIVD